MKKKVETSHKLFHNLKSQGISVNIIIIAAIALIVLVVLVAVFTGNFGDWTKKLTERSENDCVKSLGGICKATCSDTEVRAFGAKCATGICCVPS